MRRSTAAAVGTLTGAALIIGVRLSVAAPAVTAAPPPVDLSDTDLAGSEVSDGQAGEAGQPTPSGSGKASKEASGKGSTETSGKQKNKEKEKKPAEPSDGGARQDGPADGVYRGSAVTNPYGTVRVSIKISDGKISAVDATYPTTADSGRINPPAVAALKQETLKAQSADVDAVSGATFTSESYVKSLQAALDSAGA
ncbi:FMN-binding protein [Mangrovihabitans endophyticus]|uniref:FMN-binding domain-containing protein n=1 Tax=Mangrovihabitans endophyticus TaxID=1751298 RepID=A0A8J3C5M7_9ACTN|nr:FMN-binding protein [Mangrovihabitans endophyticus]GGL18536.1 hypothetical protein GCM10012284_61470 [Mangrovihabitans endophyticus]